MADFDYVIRSGYQPFSMQEALTPFLMYKDAYDKAEAKYEELSEKVDTFRYLSKTLPEDSKARQIYEGYANEYEKYKDEFAENGLTMMSGNGLGNMRRRYAGEIGMLAKAQSNLEKWQALRDELAIKDPSMLFATNSANIDSFLYGNTPNNYSISGDYLYAKGAQAGKSFSSRIFDARDAGSTLGGYYRDYIQSNGITPEMLNKFGDEIMEDFSRKVSTLPGLQQAAQQILKANGVYDNLDAAGIQKAQQQVVRGILDGAIYTESHNPQRDLGKLTASEQFNKNLSLRQQAVNEAKEGIEWVNGKPVYNKEKDITRQRQLSYIEERSKAKAGNSSTGSSSASGYYNLLNNGVKIAWDDDPNSSDYEVKAVASDDKDRSGMVHSYDELPSSVQKVVDKTIGSGSKGDPDNYIYYYKPFSRGALNDDEAELTIIPRKIVKDSEAQQEEDDIPYTLYQ